MRSGIRSNVLLVAIAPAALIALLLLIYLTNTRIRDLEQALIDRGQAIANQLGPGYALAISAAKFDALKVLAGTVLEEPDVHRITVFDHQGKVIAVQRRQGISEDEAQPSDMVVLTAPIQRVGVIGGQSQNGTKATQATQPSAYHPTPIGRVEVTLSRTATVERQHQVIATSLGMTLICLVLATLLGMRIGRKVTEPILRMEGVLQRIRQGDLDAQVVENSRGHLGNLERGINAMAKSLRESHETLREQVDQATADLRGAMRALEIKNAELEVARKRALGASRVKSEFLANVSHEIRTPLNGVLGFIELLEQTGLDQTQRSYVETVSSCAESLLVLVNDILDLSKIEAGKLELHPSSFDVRESIENAVLVFAANAQSKHLKFSLDIDPGVPSRLYGDAARISQIASNLVSNAIKFTETGAVEVQVTASPRPAGKMLLKLLVRDTGIGISTSQQNKLFNAFSQLDPSFTRRHTGTGLGLAISKRLTDLMGGTIAVESRAGQGASFRLALPLAESSETVELGATFAGFGDHEVLVSTQDPVLARAVSHILDNAAARPILVEDAAALKAALEADCKQGITRAMIIDADLDGAELEKVLDILHGFETGEKLAVVVLGPCQSPSFGEGLQGRRIELQHLAKPPRSAGLIKALRGESQQSQDRDRVGPGRVRSLPSRAAVVLERGHQKPPCGLSGEKGSTRVLLADDNPVNRRLAAIFLKQLGLLLDEVENGEEAVEACRSTAYDLVLMDVHMPVMDGIEATRQIRALDNNCNTRVPIVALTADAMHEERERFLRSGMDDHIAKPITLQALRSLIELWEGKEVAHG